MSYSAGNKTLKPSVKKPLYPTGSVMLLVYLNVRLVLYVQLHLNSSQCGLESCSTTQVLRINRQCSLHDHERRVDDVTHDTPQRSSHSRGHVQLCCHRANHRDHYKRSLQMVTTPSDMDGGHPALLAKQQSPAGVKQRSIYPMRFQECAIHIAGMLGF
jgi:hypothetical protein